MALCCNPITGNISKSVCGAKKAGLIRNLYVANYCEISGYTVNISGEVTAIDMSTDPLTSNPFYFYQIAVKKNSSGFVNEAVIGTNNKNWNQTVSFTIEGFDAALKSVIDSTIDGSAVFIGIDNFNQAHILGRLSGAELTAGTAGTGVAVDDLYGAQLTFSAIEIEITPTVAAGTSIYVLDEDGVTVNTVVL